MRYTSSRPVASLAPPPRGPAPGAGPVATPRGVDPEPMAWLAAVLTMLLAGVLGFVGAWLITRRWS